MNTILIIEDEQRLADLIKKGLEEEDYMVYHTLDGLAGMELLREKSVDLILLDILLPKMSGLEVCRKIKTEGHADVPIMMLTALGSAENIVLGLDSGADDYLSKPFKLIELKARVRALLRRKSISVKSESDHLYRFSGVEMDDETKTVRRNGQEMSLTSTEYRLLLMFMKNPRKVLSRTDLLDEVWGINFDIGTNVVDVYVNYLRKKLDKCGDGKLIHTVIGMGYVLKEAE
ncbi:response regulator transcription factor [Limibacter armeniacum]|uniref:response regulator transcription factor n=1 Tax=Limibacter armeniacum TaxID=466084 RepID=UPI002FE5BC60